jgi:hypothetical protein
MRKSDQLFDPPVSVRVVVADGDGGKVREDRFKGVTAVLFGHGGSLNVQEGQKRATMYRERLWRSWEVVDGPQSV